MKKYLLITQKESLANFLKEVYLNKKDKICYDIDFSYVVAPVSHISNKIMKIDLNDSNWHKLEFKNIKIPNGYYIRLNDIENKLNSIRSLLKDNKYDGIINANDRDVFGQLEFEFLREQLEFFGEEKRMIYNDLTDESILKAFQELEDNDEFLKYLIPELEKQK